MNRRRQKEQELDNYWESISGGFDGKVFGENRRTYAKPDEFAAKHPEWTDIYAVDLGGGAYSYEWAQQKNGYGRVKPSYAWLEWHRKEHEVKKSVFLNLTERYLMKSFKKLVLERPHKYIRRWLENGVWRYEYPKDDGSKHYTYETPSGNVVTGKFGVFLTRFKNNPAGAFRELFKRKSGQALDVVSLDLPVVEWDDSYVNKDGNRGGYVERQEVISTGIDLVYGNDGRGIKHILRNHFLDKNDFNSVGECAQSLSNLLLELQNGTRRIVSRQFAPVTDRDISGGLERIGKWELLDDRGYKMIIDVEVQLCDNERCYRHFVLTNYDITRSKEDKINDSAERDRRRAIMNQRTY